MKKYIIKKLTNTNYQVIVLNVDDKKIASIENFTTIERAQLWIHER